MMIFSVVENKIRLIVIRSVTLAMLLAFFIGPTIVYIYIVTYRNSFLFIFMVNYLGKHTNKHFAQLSLLFETLERLFSIYSVYVVCKYLL